MIAKLLIADYDFEDFKEQKEIFKDYKIKLVTAQCRTEDEVIKAARGVDGIISLYAPITKKVIESIDTLKVIGRYGTGVDVVDINTATKHGVYVVNVSDYCTEEASNHTMAFILAVNRKIICSNNYTKSGKWDSSLKLPIHPLKGKILGLVGFGKIAKQVALKTHSFGIKTLTYFPNSKNENLDLFKTKIVSFKDLILQSDFISIHVPLNEKTIRMFGENEFVAMKKSAYIINTSRGQIIDQAALIKAVKNKTIAGACLDVFEHEPLQKDNPLTMFDNVILTSHIAWYSEESRKERDRQIAQNVKIVINNGIPDDLVNKEVLNKKNDKENCD